MRTEAVYLPVLFNDGLPVLKWFDEWDLSIFDQIKTVTMNKHVFDEIQFLKQ